MKTFRRYRVPAGKMLCFFGPDLKRNQAALRSLTDRGFLIEEQFKGGYSLTDDGFEMMKGCPT